MTDEKRECLTAVIGGLIVLLIMLLCGTCKADCLVNFTATWCGPCQAMYPRIEQLKREGYDIRTVDIDKQPELKAGYKIRCVPTTVMIAETAHGNFELGRIEGTASAGQLRRLAAMPVATTVGAASRNAVRGMFFGIGGFVEW